MLTPKAIVAKAMTFWVDKGDPALGPATSVKLSHIAEGRPPSKLDSWAIASKNDVQRIINDILETAQGHASSAQGKTVLEEYWITPYYGEGAGTEGGYRRFFLRATSDMAGDDGEGLGGYTEGATKTGQIHQGMRHNEALAKIHVEGIARLESSRQTYVDQLLKDNEMLRTKLAAAEAAAEEARDKSLERKLTIYRADQEEDRKNKIVEAAIPATMQLVNSMTGAPIFPVNSDNAALIQLRAFLSSFTKAEVEGISASLSMEKRFVFESILSEVLAAEREEAAQKAKMAEQRVNGSAQGNEKTIENLAKRTPQNPEPPVT